MRPSTGAAAAILAGHAAAAQTTDHSDLTGTWTTKSNSTITGPGFYDPISDRFIEPTHPGISYSFTSDGHWESAYYRAIASPTSPECASAILQFQHGTFELLPNGSLVLTPIASDGRQLESAPCKGTKAVYLRHEQSELHQRYHRHIDSYHGIPRLDLYQFNSAPLPPMYLAYEPPMMVPTTTLRPAKPTDRGKVKRSSADEGWEGMEEQASIWLDRDVWWWVGLGMTGAGSVLYWCF